MISKSELYILQEYDHAKKIEYNICRKKIFDERCNKFVSFDRIWLKLNQPCKNNYVLRETVNSKRHKVRKTLLKLAKNLNNNK